jgi:hypothetical protein
LNWQWEIKQKNQRNRKKERRKGRSKMVNTSKINLGMTKHAELTIRSMNKRDVKESMLEMGLKKERFHSNFTGEAMFVSCKNKDTNYFPFGKGVDVEIFSDNLEKSAQIYNKIHTKFSSLNDRYGRYICSLTTPELENYLKTQESE